MNRIVYAAIVLSYASIAILGSVGNAYSEYQGAEKVIGRNIFLLIVVAVPLAIFTWHYFRKLFPAGYEKQHKIGKIVLPVVFLLLSAAATVGVMLFVNASFGKPETIRVNGFIANKWIVYGHRSSDHFIGLIDSSSHRYYAFKVQKSIYEQVGNKGDKISKNFYKGCLGVIYRYRY